MPVFLPYDGFYGFCQPVFYGFCPAGRYAPDEPYVFPQKCPFRGTDGPDLFPDNPGNAYGGIPPWQDWAVLNWP